MIFDAPEYAHFVRGVTVDHYGLRSSQNQIAMLAISILLDKMRPENIIELGTGSGGLSILIGIWARIYGKNFRTYDKSDQRHTPDIFNALNIQFIQDDVYEAGANRIAPHIQQPGITLVLCDNGDKERELGIYAPKLKLGDYIMMHDYARNKEEFSEKISHGRYWDWHESSENAATSIGLIPVYTELLEYAVWGCFRKEREFE